ncbi:MULTISPECIES: DNA primase [Paenibacillus]|uniref:DNA primase n=1 Tax=Paenibacillus vandeheii TaxID=3035917 RepID=A0ABT8JFR2_9BACL|nr:MULTISPECIES: DNA primase [Paenibacillus]MDN4603919.1 DNA primase [Paenibacillus vandeheii]
MIQMTGLDEMCRDFATKAAQKIDIVTVIQDFLVLRQSGQHFYSFCPFHDDSKATFIVDQREQSFNCPVCGKMGDYYDFLSTMAKKSKPDSTATEVIKQIQEDYIGENYSHLLRKSSERFNEVKSMYEAHDYLANVYHEYLLSSNGKLALTYLTEKRGITLEAIKEFNIGYAPDINGFATESLQAAGFNLALMLECGLVGRNDNAGKYYDYFRGRIVFPIYDTDSKVVGFGGRAMNDKIKPKYLNTKETPIFKKSEHLYNFNRVKGQISEDTKLVFFEGYVDVVAAWQSGCKTGVASLGTSVSNHHSRMVSEYTDQAIICFDGDLAGQKATSKAIHNLQRYGIRLWIAHMPQDLDPADYIEKFGDKSFKELVQTPLSIVEYYFRKSIGLVRTGDFLSFKTALDKYIFSIEMSTNYLSDVRKSELTTYFHQRF